MVKITKIFYHGCILTMDAADRVVEAVALAGNQIYQVGNDETILSLADKETICIDLHGKTMLPGLYECHGHFQLASDGENNKADLAAAPLGEKETLAQCLEALQQQRDKTSADQPIYGYRFDNSGIIERRHLYREDLDQISLERPVIVNHISNHLAYLNSKALQILNITKDTPDPPGGLIQKDSVTGEPNGVLEENAMYLTPEAGMLIMSIQYSNLASRFAAWEKTTLQYASLGVTTANDAVCYPETALLYRQAAEEGYLKIRMSINPAFDYYTQIVDKGNAHPFVTVGGAKLFQDGSIQGYTASLCQPYHVPPEKKEIYYGYPTRSRESLREMVMKAQSNGWQLVVHNCGDAGLEDYLCVLEEAAARYPQKDSRHVALHCIVVQEQQLERMARLHMIASFFVDHVYYWGEKHCQYFLGEARGSSICPMQSAIKKGIMATIHCDNPSGPELPFVSIWSAVARKTMAGRVIGEEERIAVKEALRAYTIGAAYQFFEEGKKGSIEPGKLADLIVIDRNPMQCPLDAIKDTKVLLTIVDGNTVYQTEV